MAKRKKKKNLNSYYNFSEEELEKLFKKKKYKANIEWEKDKSEVRKTREWLELKCFCYNRQEGRDPINGRKLPKTSNLHHLDQHDENYGDFNSDKFVLLSQLSHKCVHYILSCMHNADDPEDVLDVLRDLYKKTEKYSGDIKTWKQAH